VPRPPPPADPLPLEKLANARERLDPKAHRSPGIALQTVDVRYPVNPAALRSRTARIVSGSVSGRHDVAFVFG